MMRITHTNGNRRNRILGSRITIKTDKGDMVDRFVVRTMCISAQMYCQRHPSGEYGRRYAEAIQRALAMEARDAEAAMAQMNKEGEKK